MKTQNEDRRLQLLNGFSDKCGEELKRQRVVEAVFRTEGTKRGYSELETPILERTEAIPKELFSCWREQGFIKVNLIDYDSNFKRVGQSTGILRPEGTIPVCRWLATNLAKNPDLLPTKLTYVIDCYRNEPVEQLDSSKRRQFNQLGVESIGDSSIEADKEVIDYAFAVMRRVGIPREAIRIRLGDVRVFKELCKESGFAPSQQYALQVKIDGFSKRRSLGLDSILKVPEIEALPKSLRNEWNRMLRLYSDNPQKARRYGPDVSNILASLQDTGIPIMADFSVVRGFSYYTGPVFQIDACKEGNWNAEVGGGGRYDDLIGQNLRAFRIKKNVPATGFAFGTERLVNSSVLPKGKYEIEMSI